jgi:hypothetical protein
MVVTVFATVAPWVCAISAAPERIFERDAGPVAIDRDRPFHDLRFHDAPFALKAVLDRTVIRYGPKDWRLALGSPITASIYQ